MADKKSIMVTGATGYVAGWIIKKLVEEGFTVHAAVRDPENKEKLIYLNKIAENSPGRIIYFKSDLLIPGSYKNAMEGCDLVIHTASPFTLNVKDAQKELIDPALMGTENILNSVNEVESVKRVVLTSSVVAMYGDARDAQKYPDATITEEYWNTTSSVKNSPYSYSKTVAEQKAWKLQKAQRRWELVVINPSFVMGPGISPNATSESFKFMKQLTDGTSKQGVPFLEFGIVDVRDLALAHYNAAFLPEANGRNILCAGSLTMLQMAEILQKKFPNDKALPKKELPKLAIYIFGPFIGLNYRWIKNNVGWPMQFDNSKSRGELKIDYRSMDKTIIEFAEQVRG
jgi:dihydroflavonol-4-reductase